MLLCLCWGSTFIPLKAGLATLPPLFFAGLRFGLAAALLLFSGLFEVSPRNALVSLSDPATLLSLSYLVVVGSLLGFWLYNHLLISWPASRLALYNFVSPLIALLLGRVVFQERLGPLELLATLCLLVSVVISYSR